MGKRRPERAIVERLILDDRKKKLHEIAEESGLIETDGYDKAVAYVRQVKRSMRKSGKLLPEEGKFAPDEERLEDITKLFELRHGKMSAGAAYYMLLLNCYYRFRSTDDSVHMMAIDDTYAKNAELDEPFHMSKAIEICDKALALYMQSNDEQRIKAAKAKGFPGAGLNYTNESLIEKLEITDDEIQHLQSIRRPT